MLVGRPVAPPAAPAPVAAPTTSSATAASSTATLSDGRTVALMSLGGPRDATAAEPGLRRRWTTLLGAVTAFWGADWPRDIVIVAAASDEQFRALAGGGSDIAAATARPARSCSRPAPPR